MTQESTTFYDILSPEIEIDSIEKLLDFKIGDIFEIKIENKSPDYWAVDGINKKFKVIKTDTSIKKVYGNKSLAYDVMVTTYINRFVYLREVNND